MVNEAPTLSAEDISAYRLSFFIGILLIMALLEHIFPCRQRLISRPLRWVNNLGLVFLNSALMRMIIPVSLIWFTDELAGHHWGLFNMIEIPFIIRFILSLIILDLAIYLQHRLFHQVPVLWRLHRLHHADLDYDVTTGLRFHPIEILLSMVIKFAVVAALGAPGFAVLVFEITLNGMAIFNHANIKLPRTLDKFLRFFVVTPDVHRVHHSHLPAEYNRNFGFNLSCWDRFFGTYTAQPTAGHQDMTIGLEQFRDPCEARLDKMLTQPFRAK